MTQITRDLSTDSRANRASQFTAALAEAPFRRGFGRAFVQGSQMLNPDAWRMIDPDYRHKAKEQ
jgi:hypothetical protein